MGGKEEKTGAAFLSLSTLFFHFSFSFSPFLWPSSFRTEEARDPTRVIFGHFNDNCRT